MHVIRSHMCCPETPAIVQTNFAESIEYCRTTVAVEQIGHWVHLMAFHRDTFGIDVRQPASGHIVVPVDRTGVLAVQVRPIARESNEVSHSRRAVTASLQSRLSLTYPYARIGSFGQHFPKSITSVSYTPPLCYLHFVTLDVTHNYRYPDE